MSTNIPNVYQHRKQKPIHHGWIGRALAGWKTSAWWLCLVIILPLIFAMKYKLAFNMTPSLKFRMAIIEKGLQPTSHNDLVAYKWHGGASIPLGLEMVKRVAGIKGDEVDVVEVQKQPGESAATMLNLYEVVLRRSTGQEYARFKVKQFSRDGKPLAPADRRVIRRGEYFVVADHPDSLDSRYAVTGLIHADQVVGKVVWSW
jgi:conjugal transfer pilin signal peptidase TrbI